MENRNFLNWSQFHQKMVRDEERLSKEYRNAFQAKIDKARDEVDAMVTKAEADM